jgi:8-oxo-dGTP pyrophosphatase MutT (NUDIX family)
MEPQTPHPKATLPSGVAGLPKRLIPLRRPPLLSVVDGRFVPEPLTGTTLDAVNTAWEALKMRVPRAHDGAMLHVLGTSRNGHGGVTIHCIQTSYRFHAVGRDGIDTGVRPIGVKAVCFTPDGKILMARRGAETLNYPGMWEFSPAGTLEPGVSPADMILRELHEETGWTASAPPVARALIFDPVVRSWEVIYVIDVLPPVIPIETWECTELRTVEPGAWPAPLTPVALQMLPVVEAERRARAQ